MNPSLVDCLLERLNDEQVAYCHWKSNIDLAQATSGEMDLDFLVDREAYLRMVSILSGLGFKPAMVRWGANSPGISHFYGYDPTSDRLAHVHLFSRVLTGESFMKSHLLPFEAMLLANPRFDGQMKVASKSAELVLFMIRTFIKYGSILDLAILRKKTARIKTELAWLKEGADLNESLALLGRYCPVVEEALFMECMQAIEQDAPLSKRIRLAQEVRGRIRGYTKHSPVERATAYLKLALAQIQRRVGRRKKNKVLQAGGAVIAIVGADATGKSTVVSETGRWLGKDFLVNVIHAGKPPSSGVTAPVNAVLSLARRVKLKTSGRTGEMGGGEAQVGEKERGSLLYAVRAVALAWDRRRLLLGSWRAAAKGEIVISDRYPSNIPGAMDSPRLVETHEKGGLRASLYNRAARLERRLYNQIPPPHVVVRLQVSVETAITRNRVRAKPGAETDAYIEARHRRAWAWNRTDTARVFDISTEQPLNNTLLEIRDVIWRSI